jgi:hypothetical protein
MALIVALMPRFDASELTACQASSMVWKGAVAAS